MKLTKANFLENKSKLFDHNYKVAYLPKMGFSRGSSKYLN